MSIAPVHGLVLTLTEEKGVLEAERMIIDQRRQTLSLHSAYLYQEYSTRLAQRNLAENNSESDENDSIEEFNWDEFKVEYEAATTNLENQDKFMEMERTNIQTKIDAVTTQLENAEKVLSKNTESEMKGLSD